MYTMKQKKTRDAWKLILQDMYIQEKLYYILVST
jgi:hypothetical protein